MPSGALTLLEGSKYGTDMKKKGFIETLVQESPLLEMLPFLPFAGNALKVDVEVDLPAPGFRSVNENWTRSYGTDTERFFGVAIMGGEVFVDNYILKVASNTVNAKARQYAKFARAMSKDFDKYFFDGTGTAKDFKGVNALISEGLGGTLSMGTAALTLDKLDEAHDMFRGQARPDAHLMNRILRRKITNLARTAVTGISLIDVGTDVFGRQVTMYNDVPIRIIGDDRSGNAILDFDEASSTASIYLVAFGVEENVSGLSGLGGSFEVKDFGETEAAPGHLGRVEWYPGIAVYNPYSIVRLSAITNA